MKQNSQVNLEDILADRFKEEDYLEVPLEPKVFKIFWWFALVLAGVAVFQLLNLGIKDHQFYRGRALANMSYQVTEKAPRGVIYDRFQKPLVQNKATLNVYLVPHELPKEPALRSFTIKKVSEILGINEKELEAKIKEKDWLFSEKLLLLSDPRHDQIASLESSDLAGVRIESSFRRVHKSKAFFHLIGFVGLVEAEDLKNKPSLFIDDEIGKAGLEAYYDEELRGINGRQVFLRDAFGKVREQGGVTLSKPGRDLQTFIDGEFQEYFYNRLYEGLLALGKESGAGIALNPKNGEVLALFNIPSVDVLHLPLYLEAQNQPFFNRAISGLYSPGSTIKPLHAIAALAEGVISAEKQIFSGGSIEIPNPYYPERPSRFLDWRPHGYVDMRAAIARSSNVYFYQIGGGYPGQPGLGIERLRKWWQKFGLNEKTKIDLPGEAKGFLPSPSSKEEILGEAWRLGDTYNVAIGQGDLLVTPIELLNYISAIASGGIIYKPRIATLSRAEILRDLSSELGEYLQTVREGMRDAVLKSYGTAAMLSSLPIAVAAKTGTAQVFNNEKLNAFFVGYGPYENPEIAILILVEDAREGSLNTVPIAHDVFMWYYNHRLANDK